jgi:hypothetical protein
MAVVARKRKPGTTYRIAIRDADGKQFWESVGTDKRAPPRTSRRRFAELCRSWRVARDHVVRRARR